jgi:hypothetical protein
MRAGASLGLRIATVVAFGATAALAVTLSRGAPMHAALTSAKAPAARHAAAGAGPGAAPCGAGAASGLRVSLGPGGRVATAVTRYVVDFTNASRTPCTLAGYPAVSAYRGDGAPVGTAARHELSAAGHVLLRPGQTAYAALDVSVPGRRCGPVRATGLRVAAPGQTAARYLRRPLTVCTSRAAGEYLRVAAVQPGTGRGPRAAA